MSSNSVTDVQTQNRNRRGLMLILSSPSGAGKSTISRALLKTEQDLIMSVSVTTRKPRPGEVDGVDYIFIDKPEFDRMVRDGELLEHATVFENSYGTPRQAVEDALSAGRDVLFDVDWQGAQQIKGRMPDDMVSVFILPPSIAELEKRLLSRAQDSLEVVRKRMAKAWEEISHYPEYDFVLTNHVVEDCLAETRAILHVERLRARRHSALVDQVGALRAEADAVGASAKG